MGRRRSAATARSKQEARLSESTNPSSIVGVTTPSEGTYPPSGIAELQPENTNQTLGGVEVQPKMEAKSGNLSSKRKGKYNSHVTVRRSARLQDVVISVQGEDIEHLIEEVALSESEKEDELPTHEETETNQSDSIMGDTNLGEKIDYLVRLLKEQRKTIKKLESTAANISLSSETSYVSQTRYKSLYCKSQKKVEALTDENRQLAMKIEIAMAKLEGYEKGVMAFSDMVEKLKDMMVIANLTQAAEKTSQAKASSAKAKKHRKK